MIINMEYNTDIKLEINCGQTASKVITRVLESEGFPYDAEVNLMITDNDEIKRINGEFRDIHSPTDVLSFPMIPYDSPGDYSAVEKDYNSYVDPDTENVVLGDIVISAEKVISQAQEYEHSIQREFAFLVAHSMLHLLGYDHMEADEATVMETKQEAVLDSLKIRRE